MVKTRSGFHGVYPMIYAFFDEKGGLLQAPVVASVEAMVKHGVHGLAVLGLASEVNKLSRNDRLQLLEWVSEANAGRVPLSVTVAENSVAGQIEFARMAKERGADWLVLQPPPVSHVSEEQLLAFFSAIIDKIDLPVGIQNAPQYLGIGLSNAGLRKLAQRHPNFRVAKTEGSGVAIAQLIEETDGLFDVFNGRGGYELPDVLRAGAAGVIPGGESFDIFVKVYDAMRAGDDAQAEKNYRDVLPLIVFLEESIDHLVTYGKRVAAMRLDTQAGTAPLPSTVCTPFGLSAIRRFVDALPKL
ncbi:dihydrodipicolinate synthase family protein [Mesorhizobium sp. BAC0120]|uniref:dihydrodipicolinate synthase family protein n=1 Tax=Mesorhizobium sp. BAC0120 TaxID=3090670 RepID=UPI00298C83B8|nr:dihydrodipicolinate synthase family protein [Mesorhizobium sp. BAC0120]MDW6022917.1 dihydrodipicolinate synthase family protein [Mesorhizobium sp. BAC0120]